MTGVAVREQAGVPDLAYNPGAEIGAEDITLPRLKIAEQQTEHVVEGRVPFGAIFVELSIEDPQPVVAAAPDKATGASGPVRIYFLAGPRKSWSIEGDSGFNRYSSLPEFLAASGVTADESFRYLSYNYLVAVPAVEQDVPVKFLTRGVKNRAAKQANTLLQRAAQAGPASEVPFDLKATRQKGTKGHFMAITLGLADVKDKDREAELPVVRKLAAIAASANRADPTPTVTSDAPDIG